MFKMSNKIYFFFAVLFIFSSCETKQSTDQRISQKQAFFKTTEVFETEESLKRCLDSLKITKEEIVQHSKKSQDYRTISKFVKAVYLGAKNNNQKGAKEDFWADIRYDIYEFNKLIFNLREPNTKTFMDIGCGSGQKIFASLCLGFEKVWGLEYSEESYGYAQEFLKPFIDKKLVEITKGDALAIEGSYFAKSDFIYMYSPMKDNKKMAELYHRAMQNMKVGAILLEVRMVYFREIKELSKMDIPQHKGFFAVKKTDTGFLYQNVFNDEWEKLEKFEIPAE